MVDNKSLFFVFNRGQAYSLIALGFKKEYLKLYKDKINERKIKIK